jgi:hypothetical protein
VVVVAVVEDQLVVDLTVLLELQAQEVVEVVLRQDQDSHKRMQELLEQLTPAVEVEVPVEIFLAVKMVDLVLY